MTTDTVNKYRVNFVTCHKLPERSFFWKGKQFPVCSRCTGIYLGYITFPFFSLGLLHLSLLISILIVLPTLIDGMIQAYTKWESTNLIRFTTGLISGIGQMSLTAIIGHAIGNYILKNFL